MHALENQAAAFPTMPDPCPVRDQGDPRLLGSDVEHVAVWEKLTASWPTDALVLGTIVYWRGADLSKTYHRPRL